VVVPDKGCHGFHPASAAMMSDGKRERPVMTRHFLLSMMLCCRAPVSAEPLDWRTGLQNPGVEAKIPLKGKRYAVYTSAVPRFPQSVSYQLTDTRTVILTDTYSDQNTNFDELRDADTGEVLLARDYNDIVAIPEVGIFVNPPQRRYAELDKKEKGTFWLQFDPATRQLVPTNIVRIELDYADRTGDQSLPPELKGPGQLVVRQVGNDQLEAEVFSPLGHSLGKYPNYAPPPYNKQFPQRARFAIISTFRPDGSVQDHLLGRFREKLLTPPQRLMMFFTKGRQQIAPGGGWYDAITTCVGCQAPGTAPSEDLWLLLGADGTFSAPPGVTAFRPLNFDCTPEISARKLKERLGRHAAGWLVRYPKGWGQCDSGLTNFTGPVYDLATIVVPAVPENMSIFWHTGAFLVTKKGRTFTSEPLAAGFDPNKWEDTRKQTGQLRQAWIFSGSSLQQVVQTTLERCQAQASRLQAQRDAELAYNRAAERARNQAAWEDAVRRRDTLAMQRLVWAVGGGDNWYVYASALYNPSPELLEDAALKVTDPAKAAELRKRAVVRRQQVLLERQTWRTSQSQQASTPPPSRYSINANNYNWSSSSSLPMQYSNPGLYNYRSQSSGGWKPMPWDPK
jgi:hypothetical protein